MHAAGYAACAIATAGCASDLLSRRIPNALTLGGALAGLIYMSLSGGLSGAAFSLGGFGVGLAVFLIPFLLGGFGAGDVKLLAALGAWLGPADAVWLALYTGVAGGVMALAVALVRGYLPTALGNVYLMLTEWRVSGLRAVPGLTLDTARAPRLAYAVPILVGTMVTLWLR
jgi:prepilin peptidase CpaA